MANFLSSILDSTVVFSFDRTGFKRHAESFDPADLDVDLTGRNIIVTGANAGIGKETTRALAARGATVAMLCRNRERGEAARQELMNDEAVAAGGGELHLVLCDVSDLQSVDAAIADLPFDRIDVLIHNAGVLLDERQTSAQGLELTLATHLAGPMRMTWRALDRMPAGARIVWVSSGGMYTRHLSVKRLSRTTGAFDTVKAYADVKRAQVVVNELLAERLESRGIRSLAMHPGWASTGGVKSSLPTFYRVTRAILRTPAEGADTVIWLAASQRAGESTGEFFFDREPVSTHLMPNTEESPEEREKLWAAVHRWANLPQDAFE